MSTLLNRRYSEGLLRKVEGVIDVACDYHERFHRIAPWYIASMDINGSLCDFTHRADERINETLRTTARKGGAALVLTQNSSDSANVYLSHNAVDPSLILMRALHGGAIIELWVNGKCARREFLVDPEELMVSRQIVQSAYKAVKHFCDDHHILCVPSHPTDVRGWEAVHLNGYTGVVGYEASRTDCSIDVRLRQGERLVVDPYFTQCVDRVAREVLETHRYPFRWVDSIVSPTRGFLAHHAEGSIGKVEFLDLLSIAMLKRGGRVAHFGDDVIDARAMALHRRNFQAWAPEGSYFAATAHRVAARAPEGAIQFLETTSERRNWW